MARPATDRVARLASDGVARPASLGVVFSADDGVAFSADDGVAFSADDGVARFSCAAFLCKISSTFSGHLITCGWYWKVLASSTG